MFTNKCVYVCMCKMSVYQTCQPLVKENLETHEQKSGDSAKNSQILLFFPNQTLPFENGGQTRRETISY